MIQLYTLTVINIMLVVKKTSSCVSIVSNKGWASLHAVSFILNRYKVKIFFKKKVHYQQKIAAANGGCNFLLGYDFALFVLVLLGLYLHGINGAEKRILESIAGL